MQCASFTKHAHSARLRALKSTAAKMMNVHSFWTLFLLLLAQRRMSSEIKGAQRLLQAPTQCRHMRSVGMYTSRIHWDNEKVKLALATRLEGEVFRLSTSQEADIQRFCEKGRKDTSSCWQKKKKKSSLKLDDQSNDFCLCFQNFLTAP